ncbi:hypothetical protein JCM11491_002332 [Sporobolomyces phaffii]
MVESTKLPLRHNYEVEFCPRCKFAGHSASTCPKFPCSSCNRAGHISTMCLDPTGRFAPRPSTFAPKTPVQKKAFDWTTIVHTPREPRSTTRRRAEERTSGANALPVQERRGFEVLEVEGGENALDSEDFPQLSPSGVTKQDRRDAAKKARKAPSTATDPSSEGLDQHIAKKPAPNKSVETAKAAGPVLGGPALAPSPDLPTPRNHPRGPGPVSAPSSLSGSLDNTPPDAAAGAAGAEDEDEDMLSSDDETEATTSTAPATTFLSQYAASPSILLLQEHKLSDPAVNELFGTTPFRAFSTRYCLALLSPPLYTALSRDPTPVVSPDGRVLSLHLDFAIGTSLTVTNIYAPVRPELRRSFFESISIPHRPGNVSLIGGDFNDCPNPDVDRKNQGGHTSHWRALVAKLRLTYVDAVRTRHPSRPLFTRPHVIRGEAVSWSRIDHILLNARQKSILRDAFVRYDAPCSDHRPVTAIVQLAATTGNEPSLPQTNALSHRAHPDVFRDRRFLDEFRWSHASLRDSLQHLPADAAWEYLKAHARDEALSFGRRLARERTAQRRSLELELRTLESLPALDETQKERWNTIQANLVTLAQESAKSLFLRSKIPHFADASHSAHTLHARISARAKSSTFPAIGLPDGTTTVDLRTALDHVRASFAAVFTPDKRPSDVVHSTRQLFLQHVHTSSPRSDPRFARRWDAEQASRLDDPITPIEVRTAIRAAPNSSSPGLSGLPYEFYKATSDSVVEDLARAFNAMWDAGRLQPSQSEARVRLLFKYQKPGADPLRLDHYRPISLRDTDYRLLARILVARLNPLLAESIPRSQIGFVPGRDASEAGLHLQLLIEEISALGLPAAALLSLDQEKAYDRVEHDYVLETYAAFGAPTRFLRLLGAIYDSRRLSARYNVNGFFTDPVALRCGLPQGCPLSCASWLLAFQPFLDALVRRRIALRLTSPIHQLRPEIVTSIAFADDSTCVVESLSLALPALDQLAKDWHLATNGRLNTGKTVALAIGPRAQTDPLAGTITWSRDEDLFVWAGFPVGISPQPSAFYTLLLERIRRRCDAARSMYGTPRTRAIYANTYIIPLALHVLAFYPAPSTFLKSFEQALRDLVWGSGRHANNKETIFRPVDLGGLGLLRPADFDLAFNLRRLDALLSSANTLYWDLLLCSFRRHSPIGDPFTPTRFVPGPWSFFRRRTKHSAHPLWEAIGRAADRNLVQLRLTALSTSQILSLPPCLFHSHPALDRLDFLVPLFAHGPDKSLALQTLPPRTEPVPLDRKALGHARWEWQFFASTHPILSRHFPSPKLSASLPRPEWPGADAFTFLGLEHGFSAGTARQALVRSRVPPVPTRPIIAEALSMPHSDGAWVETWKWIQARPATPRESDTHWRLLYSAKTTRALLSQIGLHDDPTCVFCRAAPDTVSHAFFNCDYSKQYWSHLLDTISSSLSPAFTEITFSPAQILLGLPTLRGAVDERAQDTIRALVAISLQELADARWSRIKSDPLHSSPSPSALSRRAIERVLDRLR